MLLQACARISPRTSAIHGTKSKEPARQEKSPASAAEMKVIIRTAARDEINHLEITSRSSHSSLETVGMTVNAFFHIVKFMSILLFENSPNYIEFDFRCNGFPSVVDIYHLNSGIWSHGPGPSRSHP